jgi:hypothetical protein
MASIGGLTKNRSRSFDPPPSSWDKGHGKGSREGCCSPFFFVQGREDAASCAGALSVAGFLVVHGRRSRSDSNGARIKRPEQSASSTTNALVIAAETTAH